MTKLCVVPVDEYIHDFTVDENGKVSPVLPPLDAAMQKAVELAREWLSAPDAGEFISKDAEQICRALLRATGEDV